MFALTQYVWLWAGAAALIPVILHLRNSKRNKVLKIGSVKLLEERIIKNAGKLKLSDLLLLLLRCLLLFTIAVLLAAPYYLQEKSNDEKGWILIAPNVKRTVLLEYRKLIDSLQKQGFSIHDLTDGFPTADPDAKAIRDSSVLSDNYWTRMKQLDAILPHNTELYMFTGKEQKYFRGERPAISLNVQWFTVNGTTPDSSQFIGAYETFNKTVKGIAVTTIDSNIITAHKDAGKDPVTENLPVQIDTATISIVVHAPKAAADANYLMAAVESLRDYSERKIKLLRVDAVENFPSECYWLFWLSDGTLPSSIQSKHVFRYAFGKSLNVYEPLFVSDEKFLTGVSPVFIRKLVSNENGNAAVWSTGTGKTVLSKDRNDGYVFYSRFHPLWTDLPWSKHFPGMLADIILKQQADDYADKIKAFDSRTIAAAAVLPRYEKTKLNKVAAEKKDLRVVFGLFAFVLLIAERLITFRLRQGGRYV